MKAKKPMVTITLEEYNCLNDIVKNKHVVHTHYTSGFNYSEWTTVYSKEGIIDKYIQKIEILDSRLENERNKSLLKRIFG